MGKYTWLLLILLFNSCSKDDQCPKEILIPLEIVPIKQKYKIGDSIKIISIFSNKVKDVDNNLYDFEGNKWKFNFALISLNDDVNGKSAQTSVIANIMENVDLNLKHFLSYSDDSYEGFYSMKGDSLYLEITCQLKMEGTFSTIVGVLTGPPQEATSSCRNGWVFNPPLWYSTNMGMNYNLDLAQDLQPTEIDHWINNPAKLNKHGGYIFNVVP